MDRKVGAIVVQLPTGIHIYNKKDWRLENGHIPVKRLGEGSIKGRGEK
jgi:hypothetical protein